MKDQLRYWAERVALHSDRSAYENLFFHLYTPLVACSLGILKSKESAEEVVSDVFVKLWRERSKLTKVLNIQVYLYVCVKNDSLKYLARHKRMKEISWENLPVDVQTGVSLSPEEMLISNQTVMQIESAIESLPPRCKVIFKMVREDGLPYKEVAEILNISVKTIDAQMAIATRKINESIGFLMNQ